MPRVWSGDGWRLVARVDRGALMVFSEREWRRRAWRFVLKRTIVWTLRVCYLLMFFVFLVILRHEPLVFLVLITVTAVLSYIVIMLLMGGWDLLMGPAVPGLYERGIELLQGRFVPYEEVVGVKLWGNHIGVLVGPGRKRFVLWLSLYGRESMARLDVVMAGKAAEAKVEQPPRLVVYGEER